MNKTKNILKFCLPASMVMALLLTVPAAALDWPARLHDMHRSGITSEQLTLPLSQQWALTTARTPKSAWSEPAESPNPVDFWNNWVHKPTQNFDNCFDVAAVGNYVYFGSSNSGALTCLNASNSSVVWTYFTGGPVRFAPFVDSGRVYFGSDDGYVYCLDAGNGTLIWSSRVGPTDEMIWSNNQMSSVWPVRGGVVVSAGYVYWAAGIWPSEGMYLCKRDALSGTGGWTKTPTHPPQGYLLSSSNKLYVPCGRTFPGIYSTGTGRYVSDIKYTDSQTRGCWAVLSPDENEIYSSPHWYTYIWLGKYNAGTGAYIGYVSEGNYMVVDNTYAYYNTDSQIIKVNRSGLSNVWSKNYAYPHSLIMAGNTLFAGGDGQIAAFNTSDGTRTWTAAVNGKAWGLAVANGRLFASTDTGAIHCFGIGSGDTTPPTPNPMTWATEPYATGSTSIRMVATTASDPSGVEYYFTCTAGGGHDSGWQDSTTYEDTGLQPNTQYTYTVKARDKSVNHNETAASTAKSATTQGGGSPPGQATNPNPSNGLTNVST